MDSTSYWLTSLLFPVNRPSLSWHSFFKTCPSKSKVKVKDELQIQSHEVGQTSYWLTSLSSMSIYPPIPGIRFLKIWLWKSKAKVIAQVHIVRPTPYRFTSLLFHVTPPIPEILLFLNLTLKIQGQGHGRVQSHKVCFTCYQYTSFIQCLKSCRSSCLESQGMGVVCIYYHISP